MEVRKYLLVSSLLVISIWAQGSLSNPVLSSDNRSTKALEAPKAPQSQDVPTSLEDASSRGYGPPQNMMLYRSIFTLSLKLLTVFLIAKLIGYAATGRAAYPQQVYYPTSTVDVSHNPGASIAGQQPAAVGGSAAVVPSGTVLTSGAAPAVSGGYLSAASTNSRPSFLFPRFRFGFRHPPPPMHMGPMSHHNNGQQTQVVETHSHMFVMPDGSQVRVPMATKPQTSVKVSTSSSETSPEGVAVSTERPNPDTVSITNEEGSKDGVSQVAQRRSSPVFREKQYTDWSLHFNPGTRSL